MLAKFGYIGIAIFVLTMELVPLLGTNSPNIADVGTNDTHSASDADPFSIRNPLERSGRVNCKFDVTIHALHFSESIPVKTHPKNFYGQSNFLSGVKYIDAWTNGRHIVHGISRIFS